MTSSSVEILPKSETTSFCLVVRSPISSDTSKLLDSMSLKFTRTSSISSASLVLISVTIPSKSSMAMEISSVGKTILELAFLLFKASVKALSIFSLLAGNDSLRVSKESIKS